MSNKKSIVQWCKDQTAQGNELKIVWEGGGDSGWVHFEDDAGDVDNDYTRTLVNEMENTLDYGSWAGEFSSNGTAIYNPDTNSFEGTDYYGEDTSEIIDCDILVQIPKKLWFETLRIECECYNEDNTEVSVRFIIKNGFLTQEHIDFCSNLEETLKDKFNSIFDNYNSVDGYEFKNCTDEWVINKSDTKEEGDMLVFTMNKIDLGVMGGDEKTIVLELDEELANRIDEQLNDIEDEN